MDMHGDYVMNQTDCNRNADFANMKLLKINVFTPEGYVTIMFGSIMFTGTHFLIWNLY